MDDRRPQIPGGEEIISIYPVGLDHDKILHARTVVGEKAQRLRLVFSLQVQDSHISWLQNPASRPAEKFSSDIGCPVVDSSIKSKKGRENRCN